MNLSDPELRLLDEHVEDALAEIVRRYMDLLYSAALRQVGGSTPFAEDVAQQVFADFVRKAAMLRGHTNLGGWFHASAHYAAAKLVRRELRRKVRDAEASKMNAIEANMTAECDWEHLRPVLDRAIHHLGERDRATVLLRYPPSPKPARARTKVAWPRWNAHSCCGRVPSRAPSEGWRRLRGIPPNPAFRAATLRCGRTVLGAGTPPTKSPTSRSVL